jgi:hypothetical protein
VYGNSLAPSTAGSYFALYLSSGKVMAASEAVVVSGPSVRYATDLSFGAPLWNEPVLVELVVSSRRSARDSLTLRRLGGEGSAVPVSVTLLVPPPTEASAGPLSVAFEGPHAPSVPGRYHVEYFVQGVTAPAAVSDEFVVSGPVLEVRVERVQFLSLLQACPKPVPFQVVALVLYVAVFPPGGKHGCALILERGRDSAVFIVSLPPAVRHGCTDGCWHTPWRVSYLFREHCGSSETGAGSCAYLEAPSLTRGAPVCMLACAGPR